MSDSPTRPADLLLVGGGHAHVQVLRRFAMQPPPDCRLTLVVDTPIAVYSGMVPGFVAGQYESAELEIDVVPLARRAGARLVLSAAIGIEPGRRRLLIADRPPLRYDLVSFDVGSTVAGLDLPGVREHAFPTRPIGRFVARLEELLERSPTGPGGEAQITVVGAGAGGLELAFCLERRLEAAGRPVAVSLVESDRRILPGYPETLVRRLERRARERGLQLLLGRRVEAVERSAVRLDGGESLPSDVTVWVTGAVSQPLFVNSGLPTDGRGFVRVRSTLQVDGHDEIFAVGDCATLIEHPDTPKAGVYAVRQGPYVADNLAAALAGGRLRRYRPQGDFLTLLNLGDGEAAGAKWGLSFEGAWVMRLKDRIDRRFMRRFQVLEPDGAPTGVFTVEPPMDDGTAMLCGGCAAKLGQHRLEKALARLDPAPPDPTIELGLAAADDAAVWRLRDGHRVVASVDAFRGFTDDPWLVGRVGAINALSDLWAKGARPRWALALVTLPESTPGEADDELLYQVLAGARSALDEAGVTLAGGHTTTGSELMVGFAVEGPVEAGDRLLRLDGLEAGQQLVLTKPLGTGVVLYADMHGLARGPWLEATLASMQLPNAAAARVAIACGATAATDVTGFGLAGHLAAMARASGLAVELDVTALPALPGAVELLGRGVHSTFHGENSRLRKGMRIDPAAGTDPRLELLFDPQTSGGLLFGVATGRVAEALEELRQAGCPEAALVGSARPLAAGEAPLSVRPG